MQGRSERISAHIRNNVVGYVAIFLFATGGIASAVPGERERVTSVDIVNGEVRSPDLAKKSVHAGKIANRAVNGKKVKDRSLRGRDIAAGSVGGTVIADGSLRGSDVAPDSLGGPQIDERSLDRTVLQRRIENSCTNSEAISGVSASGEAQCVSTAAAGPAGGDLAGAYPDPTLAPDAVQSGEIEDGEVTGDDIDEQTLDQVPAAVTADSATTADSAASAADTELFDGLDSVAFLLGADTLPAGSDLSGTYASPQLRANSVGAAEVAPDALGGADIDESDLDRSVLQRRLDSSCNSGQAIRSVSNTGVVVCEDFTPADEVLAPVVLQVDAGVEDVVLIESSALQVLGECQPGEAIVKVRSTLGGFNAFASSRSLGETSQGSGDGSPRTIGSTTGFDRGDFNLTTTTGRTLNGSFYATPISDGERCQFQAGGIAN